MGIFILRVERPKQDNVVSLEMLHLQVSLRTGDQICLKEETSTRYKMFFPLSNEANIKSIARLDFDDTQNIYCIEMTLGTVPFFSYLHYCIYVAAIELGFEPILEYPLEECIWYGKRYHEADLSCRRFIFKVDQDLDIIDPETLSRIDENSFYIEEA